MTDKPIPDGVRGAIAQARLALEKARTSHARRSLKPSAPRVTEEKK